MSNSQPLGGAEQMFNINVDEFADLEVDVPLEQDQPNINCQKSDSQDQPIHISSKLSRDLGKSLATSIQSA